MQIPLFPLSTVLFPGGLLPLRIFEPRYLTMIGDCMRTASSFGVVLIYSGKEAGLAAEFHRIGTLAQVEDFDQLEDGYLGVSCRGGQRFSVQSHKVQDDQLVVAEVESVPEISDGPIAEEFVALKVFLQELLNRDELKGWASSLAPDWNSIHWLSCRLCEILPLSTETRQALLEMDFHSRSQQLKKVMLEHKMI